MTIENLAEGIAILRKYYKDGNGYHVGAEHDQIFFCVTDAPMTPDDAASMSGLGFFQPDTPDEDGYSPEDWWSAFT